MPNPYTYRQRATLMADPDFRDRLDAACRAVSVDLSIDPNYSSDAKLQYFIGEALAGTPRCFQVVAAHVLSSQSLTVDAVEGNDEAADEALGVLVRAAMIACKGALG